LDDIETALFYLLYTSRGIVSSNINESSSSSSSFYSTSFNNNEVDYKNNLNINPLVFIERILISIQGVQDIVGF
jgi:hypothetical protein